MELHQLMERGEVVTDVEARKDIANPDYSGVRRFRERAAVSINRLRNRALGFRYGGKRVEEERELAAMRAVCEATGMPCPEPARLVTKGKAV